MSRPMRGLSLETQEISMNTQAQAMERYQGGLHVDPDVLMTGMRQISRMSASEREPLRMSAGDFGIFATQVAQVRRMALSAIEGVNSPAANQLRESLSTAAVENYYPGLVAMERHAADKPAAGAERMLSRQGILQLVQAARMRVQVATESMRGVAREQILQQASNALDAIDECMAAVLNHGPHGQAIGEKLAAMRTSLDQVVDIVERESRGRMNLH